MIRTDEPAMTESREVAKQIEVELALLLNIEQAFRVALDWKTNDGENNRKLSTLRFVTRSFERHLARIRMLSDYGGYMVLVTDMKPQLASAVRSLKLLRDNLQAHLDELMFRLEHVSANETAKFDELCKELEHYLEDLSAHGAKEMELLQRGFADVEGGAG